MFDFHFSLLSKTKSLENEIDKFHNKLIDVSMTFNKAVKSYMKGEKNKDFKKYSIQIKNIEHEADSLRRDIENKLYSHNLLPDLRAALAIFSSIRFMFSEIL
jgi:uncharacterized protein Yka (UPF0111/DUF47 family)